MAWRMHGRGQTAVRILQLLLHRLEQASHPLLLELRDLAIQRATGFAGFFRPLRRGLQEQDHRADHLIGHLLRPERSLFNRLPLIGSCDAWTCCLWSRHVFLLLYTLNERGYPYLPSSCLSSRLCDVRQSNRTFTAWAERLWQASGAKLTAHFSHPSSGEV